MPFGDNVDLDRYGRAAGHLRRIKRSALERRAVLSLVSPSNRATVRRFFTASRADRSSCARLHARELEIRELLDTIAALGFATAMNVSGVNIVRIEQRRDFALANWAAPTAEIYPVVARGQH